ncbi:hypothetical protein Taro_031361 [Colocasia esculenta]|uniref:Uncharacterized protein n=1 Tax=Colocasia esculenta TaxID=4460 RepID=A0A843VPV0_COLES|nr:hypothetical protein [Colocasia esculenta]
MAPSCADCSAAIAWHWGGQQPGVRSSGWGREALRRLRTWAYEAAACGSAEVRSSGSGGLLEVPGFRLPSCWEIVGVCSLLKVSSEDDPGALQRMSAGESNLYIIDHHRLSPIGKIK